MPVEVKSKRAQALALRWIMDATSKRKNKTMADKLYAEFWTLLKTKGLRLKNERIHTRWQSQIKHLLISGGN